MITWLRCLLYCRGGIDDDYCNGDDVDVQNLCCLLYSQGGRAAYNCDDGDDDFDKDKDEEHVDVHNIVKEVDNCDDDGDDVEDEDEEFVYLYNLCCRGGES